jgi:drug/metabolite transporter (DMT)-like permease
MDAQHTDGSVLGVPAIWIGNFLLALSVLCEASYAVIGKKLTENMPPKRIAALINAWGFILALPLGLWAAWHFDFSAVSMPIWLLLVFYGLAASAWTVWLWMTGLKKIPASQAGVFTVVLPISAALTGVIFLGEKVSLVQAVAFAIALLGVLIATDHNQSMTCNGPEKIGL